MITTEQKTITIATLINAPVEKVWTCWTHPQHILHWNSANADWHTTRAENNLQVGGTFSSRMEAKDGSTGFDFWGEYTKVEQKSALEYRLGDNRKVSVSFIPEGGATRVKETFEIEDTHSAELQRTGWQSILDNFKKYVENTKDVEPLHFDIEINASAEKVYQTMLDEQKYKEWTAVFNQSSHFVGSWQKGSKIMFIGTDKDGTKGGMVSRIKENIPHRFVSIEHLGLIQGDDEITSGPQVEGWAGALENYTFLERDGKTLLSVDMDANDEFKSYFFETWPKALQKLKELSEA